MLVNLQFNTNPLVVHAPGPLRHKPHWQEVRDTFFSSPPLRIGTVEGLTIVTWNNGHEAMGVLEKSLDHLGVPYVVKGAGVSDWINSKHKPPLTCEALNEAKTKYVMGLDSRDAMVLGDPRLIVQRFEENFSCDMVFGADIVNWPNLPRFKSYEESLPGAQDSAFKYLNGGMWIGKTEFCREFFAAATQTEAVAEAPDSEQGILKQLFQVYYPRVQLDYRCQIFQNYWLFLRKSIRMTPNFSDEPEDTETSTVLD
jgi:hypothetical protein